MTPTSSRMALSMEQLIALVDTIQRPPDVSKHELRESQFVDPPGRVFRINLKTYSQTPAGEWWRTIQEDGRTSDVIVLIHPEMLMRLREQRMTDRDILEAVEVLAQRDEQARRAGNN